MKTHLSASQKASEEQARLAKEITATKNGVVFHCAGNYTVDWNRIRNEPDVLSWIYHLSGKEWFTPDRLGRFLELVAEKKNLDLHCAP